ncbi:hypothetical protein GUITHDRAFT_147706 [Guillardia theta CCMP2712]|uniref:WSC domain-containing protein n=1 Tax=Guillardia theta (strain CCMP2712) TaxID=905079 RepID=L1IC27_GUITC|nr:hypothetical protein GUITHDRAFT_147706 [Guillardia theta CCMP2712]EKX33781.1 hypothetical protein GUITHDRAFT_147706 [Guillardia theta CCMP2712]|eukprot:XP_005820761.1 hypothetical protein GUITHDRAFT_147706 [Guillardia theta CCMP2712]
MLSLRAFLSLTLVAAALAGTCYKAEKKAAAGGCPDLILKFGSCASQTVADAGLASLNNTLQLATFNATACKTSIDALCTTNKAKGSDCATYCALASFTFSGMLCGHQLSLEHDSSGCNNTCVQSRARDDNCGRDRNKRPGSIKTRCQVLRRAKLAHDPRLHVAMTRLHRRIKPAGIGHITTVGASDPLDRQQNAQDQLLDVERGSVALDFGLDDMFGSGSSAGSL